MLPIKFFDVQGKGLLRQPRTVRGVSVLHVAERDNNNVAPNSMGTMVPNNRVRVTDVFIVNSSKTTVTLTLLFGNIAIRFGATLSLLTT